MKRLLICILASLMLCAGCGPQVPEAPLPDPVPVPQPIPEPPVPAQMQVPVLLYHAFCETPEEASAFTWVSAPMLHQQLAALREAGYRSVTLAQLADYGTRAAALPEKPILITADDGYLNNLTVAAPIFEQYGFTLSIAVIGVSEGKDSYKETGTPIIPHFSLDQARPWIEKGVVELFSHTYDMHQSNLDGADYRHSVLPRAEEPAEVYRDALAADFAKSAAQLAGLGAPALAYPHGRWTDQAEEMAAGSGFLVTLTTQPGGNLVKAGDPASLRLLNRNYVYEETTGAELVANLESMAVQ